MLQSNVGGVSVGFWWYGFIAYARKSCEISQGLEIENPSMWQAEGIPGENLAKIFDDLQRSS